MRYSEHSDHLAELSVKVNMVKFKWIYNRIVINSYNLRQTLMYYFKFNQCKFNTFNFQILDVQHLDMIRQDCRQKSKIRMRQQGKSFVMPHHSTQAVESTYMFSYQPTDNM